MKFDGLRLDKIFQAFQADSLVLPNFQRGFVWSRSKQQSFVASALVDLPVGNLLILNGKNEDFAKRALCQIEEIDVANDSCKYVLDGQQRLSTLKAVFSDIFDESNDRSWTDVWDSLYGPLRSRWFLKLIDDGENESDIFNIRKFGPVNLRQYTDEDVIGNIEYRVVHKTKITEAHHPVFLRQYRRMAIEKFSSEKAVPLWELSKGDSGIHIPVLEQIAHEYASEMRARLEESKYTKEAYLDIFENISQEKEAVIELYNDIEVYGNGERRYEKLTNAFAKLTQKWLSSITLSLDELFRRDIPVVEIERDEIDRAVAIFEAINKGGQPLSVYDLLVAKSAPGLERSNLSLRIKSLVAKPIEIRRSFSKKFFDSKVTDGSKKAYWSAEAMGIFADNEPSSYFKDWFCNTLSLIVYVKKGGNEAVASHTKKEKLLRLNTSDISDNYEGAVTAVIRALAFLQLRCGIVEATDVSYKLMVVVLAFYLYEDTVWESERAIDKLEQWYWLSLFSGHYSKSQNDKCLEDIKNRVPSILEATSISAVPFIQAMKKQILDYDGYATKDILLREDDATDREPSSVQHAILQFILSKSIPDFVPGEGFRSLSAWDVSEGNLKLHKHHIIPLGSASKIGDSSSEIRKDKNHVLNSPLNLIYISEQANRAISDDPINVYIGQIDQFSSSLGGLPSADDISSVIVNNSDNSYRDLLGQRYSNIVSSIMEKINSL